MRKVVIGLSGGMDSATLLGLLLEQGCDVHCCSFQYGSKHMSYESNAAELLYLYYKQRNYPITFHKFDLQPCFKDFNSSLMQTGGNIPEGHYEAETMKSTVVPGRNLIFASLMAGLAESLGADSIALGVHAGDHFIYPDCRPDFVFALSDVIRESSDNKITVETPLLHLNKGQILQKGLEMEIPYGLTRTCYKDQAMACGKCGSCIERLEAFENCGISDFIEYEKA